MANLAKTLAMVAACSGLGVADAGEALAADPAPIGAWRTTNQCFLAGFVLYQDGRVQAAYLTGERDENAQWTWDGATLTITSKMFDLDRFTGRIMNGHIEADYVWHDLDNDRLNPQTCVFERFRPGI